jgi:exodeoxyribonuclease VII small subunit
VATLTVTATAATSAGMTEDVSTLSFEDALKRLETIVAQLESGDVPLDGAITLYTEGDRLRAQCEARLKDAQMRIEAISLGADGAPVGTRPFDGS